MKEEQPAGLFGGKAQPPTTDHESHNLQGEKNTVLANYSKEEKSYSSTCLNQNSLQDINLRSVYVLSKNLLQGTKITSNIRARIRGFLMDQCTKQWITRDTCVLACTYIDLYLHKKGFCEVQEIQTMAIACLMLARKQQEGKLPTISYNVFSKESLLQWERKLAKRLEYQLCPPTYHTYAQHLAIKWDLFPSNKSRFNKKIGRCQTGPNMVLRLFYERLDCLFLVPETLKWDLQFTVLNMFYLHLFFLNVPHLQTPHLLSNQQFVECVYSERNQFKTFFEQFLLFYSKEKRFKLQPQLGIYLKLFLGSNLSKKEFSLLNSQPRFSSLREWDKMQTYSKQSYKLAKAVMEKIKKK